MKYTLAWLNSLPVSGVDGKGVTTEGYYVDLDYLQYWKIHDGKPFMICRGPLYALQTDEQVQMRCEVMDKWANDWRPTEAELRANGVL